VKKILPKQTSQPLLLDQPLLGVPQNHGWHRRVTLAIVGFRSRVYGFLGLGQGNMVAGFLGQGNMVPISVTYRVLPLKIGKAV